MAHRLHQGTSVRCATPHGHNELVRVDIVGPTRPLDGAANVVAEFGALKARWHRFVDEHLDHALQLSATDPLLALAAEHFPDWRIVVTPGDPTTELLAALLMSKCQALLGVDHPGLRCVRVELRETPTNSVIFEGNPGEFLPRTGGWWTRPDVSTR